MSTIRQILSWGKNLFTNNKITMWTARAIKDWLIPSNRLAILKNKAQIMNPSLFLVTATAPTLIRMILWGKKVTFKISYNRSWNEIEKK